MVKHGSSGAPISDMFDRIAFRYDLLNRLLSFGQDVVWRKKVADHLPKTERLSLLDLAPGFKPFTRCMVCNRPLREVLPEKIRSKVPPEVLLNFHEFKECPECGRIYWQGGHYRKMMARWEKLLDGTKTAKKNGT